MLGHLQNVDDSLAKMVAEKLGMSGQADNIKPRVPVGDPKPSPALSQYSKAPKSIAGKKFGVLVSEGVDSKLILAIKKVAKTEGAMVELIAPKIGTLQDSAGNELLPDHFLAGAPSSLFDILVVAPAKPAVAMLIEQAAAIDWIRDGFGHLKVIGFIDDAKPLFEKASVPIANEPGVVNVSKSKLDDLIKQAKLHRIWSREEKVR